MMSTTTEIAPQEYAEALSRVRDYKEQLQHADRQADQNSLDRARDLELLYQSMHWVDEVPAPKNTVWRGRPVDPQSRNRFASWVLQQTGLVPGTVRRLHSARELADEVIAPMGALIPDGEWALRPLLTLRNKGYGDRIPEVYKMAVQLAEGGPPTSAETRQAVRDFLARYTPRQQRERRAKNWLEVKRQEIIRDFGVLLDAGQFATAENTLNELLASYHARVPQDQQ
jgi:hypothetical protein